MQHITHLTMVNGNDISLYGKTLEPKTPIKRFVTPSIDDIDFYVETEQDFPERFCFYFNAEELAEACERFKIPLTLEDIKNELSRAETDPFSDVDFDFDFDDSKPTIPWEQLDLRYTFTIRELAQIAASEKPLYKHSKNILSPEAQNHCDSIIAHIEGSANKLIVPFKLFIFNDTGDSEYQESPFALGQCIDTSMTEIKKNDFIEWCKNHNVQHKLTSTETDNVNDLSTVNSIPLHELPTLLEIAINEHDLVWRKLPEDMRPPKKEEFTEYLINKYSISKNAAEAINTIIRPNDFNNGVKYRTQCSNKWTPPKE